MTFGFAERERPTATVTIGIGAITFTSMSRGGAAITSATHGDVMTQNIKCQWNQYCPHRNKRHTDPEILRMIIHLFGRWMKLHEKRTRRLIIKHRESIQLIVQPTRTGVVGHGWMD